MFVLFFGALYPVTRTVAHMLPERRDAPGAHAHAPGEAHEVTLGGPQPEFHVETRRPLRCINMCVSK